MNITGMRVSEFWLVLEKLTNDPECSPHEKIIFRTLDDEFGVFCIELENGVIVMQSDEEYFDA